MEYDPFTFDVRLVARARQFQLEPHTLAEVQSEVWQPTSALLRDLAATEPRALLGANSVAFERSIGLTLPRAELDLVLEDGVALVHLGMVLARRLAQKDWELLCQLAATKEMRRWLQSRGPQAVRRSSHGCVIPVETEVITQETCASGMAKYFRSVNVPLADLPITWLPDAVTVPLYEHIWDTARAQVKKYTLEDIDRVIQIELEEF